MLRTMTLAITLAGYAASAMAQECRATIPTASPVWSTVSTAPGSGDGAMKTMAHLRCNGCTPEISVLLTAGPASPALQAMPIGRQTGMAWARAVVDDPASREGLRVSVLRSELRSSPGCRLEGEVTGVAQIGNMGSVGTAIRAECPQTGLRLSGEFYSAYDGTCQYQVQVVWGPGFVPLSSQGRDELRRLLEGVAFSR